MKHAGSIASAVFEPMQWFTSVAGSSATPNSRCMNRATASLNAGDAVVGIAAVLRLVDLLGHHAADALRRHRVVLADAEVEQLPLRVVGQRLPLGPLDLLELVDRGAFAVTGPADAVGEQALEIGVGHGVIAFSSRSSG